MRIIIIISILSGLGGGAYLYSDKVMELISAVEGGHQQEEETMSSLEGLIVDDSSTMPPSEPVEIPKKKRDVAKSSVESIVIVPNNKNKSKSEMYGEMINESQDRVAVNKAKEEEVASNLKRRVSEIRLELLKTNPELFIKEYKERKDAEESTKVDESEEAIKRLSQRLSIIKASIRLNQAIEDASLSDKYKIDSDKKKEMVKRDRVSQYAGSGELDSFVINGNSGVYIPVSSNKTAISSGGNDVVVVEDESDKKKNNILAQRKTLEKYVDEFGYIDAEDVPVSIMDPDVLNYCIQKVSISRVSSVVVLRNEDSIKTVYVGDSIKNLRLREITPDNIIFNPRDKISKNYKIKMNIKRNSCGGRR